MSRPQVSGVVRAAVARPAHHAQPLRGLVRGEAAVQPTHLGGRVVPERQRQDEAAVQRLAHFLQPPLCLVVIGVAEGRLLGAAELVRDGVPRHPGHGGIRVGDDLAVLDVEPPDLRQVAGVGAVCGQELRHDLHRLIAVHLELRADAVMRLRAHAEAVHVATVLVAHAEVAFALGPVAALHATASEGPLHGARVRREGRRHSVGLPNVHLEAAHAALPVDVRLAVHPLDILGALGVAVARAKLGPGGVVALALAAGDIHLHEVERAVQAASQRRNVYLESEFTVFQLEQLVGIRAVRKVDAGAHVAAGAHELQLHTCGDALHAVGLRVALGVDSLHGALRGAGVAVGAVLLAPAALREAVLVPARRVHPTPVRVQRHRGGLGGAALCRGAELQRHRRLGLGDDGSRLLGASGARAGEKHDRG
mmetsp:Transcript_73615/g.213053  ORF Transcript_73615/g.213053 Transcript_73615/m.213053 type:complete len:422 (-) Transcript_73615:113-1378(-)